jgi:hypothetical protein
MELRDRPLLSFYHAPEILARHRAFQPGERRPISALLSLPLPPLGPPPPLGPSPLALPLRLRRPLLSLIASTTRSRGRQLAEEYYSSSIGSWHKPVKSSPSACLKSSRLPHASVPVVAGYHRSWLVRWPASSSEKLSASFWTSWMRSSAQSLRLSSNG